MWFFKIVAWACLTLAGYVYAGYPALLAALARVLRRPVHQGETRPRISLIIAAYNEADFIGSKLDNSLALDYPADLLEIIVVADGCSDGTPQVVEGYADRGVKLLYKPQRQGKSAALNRAVDHATGEILLFSDSNAYYELSAIRALVRNFNDPDVGCVSGRKSEYQDGSLVGESGGVYWKYESFIKQHESQLDSTAGLVGEMIAVRAELFEPIPQWVINDDFYLGLTVLQQGYRVIYEPAAISWETASASSYDESVRRQRINTGRYQVLFNPRRLWPWNRPLVLFQIVSHKFLRLLLPFFMAGGLLASAPVVLRRRAGPLLRLAWGAQVFFYSLALWGYVGERAGKPRKLPGVAYYLVNGNVASVRGLIGYLRGQRSVMWQKAARADSTHRLPTSEAPAAAQDEAQSQPGK